MQSPSREITLEGSTLDKAALFAGPVLIFALIVFLAGWTGSDLHHGADAPLVLLHALPWVVLWFAAAAGFGWPLRAWIAPRSNGCALLQLGLGVATLLTLEAALGRLGVLQFGGSVGAWGLIGLGCALLLFGWSRSIATSSRTIHAPTWLVWASAPAIAVLLLASVSAPGWLWASEYGGYDALSYHLQLPKEWMELGAIQPLQHNVYSFLPGYVEGAFYHLMLLRGDAIGTVYACQLLHATMALLTAAIVMRIVKVWTGHAAAGAVALAILIGTPWVIVVGSLAYNEMAAAVMLATGILLMQQAQIKPLKLVAGLGLLAATACGAKLTSLGFVAVPLGIVMLLSIPSRQWLRAVVAGSAIGLIVLSPYLIANAAITGNPVFPFATTIFGSGHWDEQQVRIWNAAHIGGMTLISRLTEAWHQFMRFGIGANPYVSEPWHAQWSVLPWLAIASLVAIGLLQQRESHTARRRWPMLLGLALAAQCAFWIALTHVKSRFMLPAVVSSSMLVAMAWWTYVQRSPTRIRLNEYVTAAVLVIWCSLPVVIFSKQAGYAPAARIGVAEMLSGAGLSPNEQRQLGEHNAAIYCNSLLPLSSRVLLVGEAAPLYYTNDYAYQTTWDRGPLSTTLRTVQETQVECNDLLQQAGFDYILIQPEMLRRWERAGWNDPMLTANRVIQWADTCCRLVHTWPTGERLYMLKPIASGEEFTQP